MNLHKYRILALFLIFYGVSFSQNFNWITPNKNYLKLYVIENGIYRITKTEFTQAGISTANIDPRTVKVYFKGGEIPVYFEGEQDGSFDANDYLDFYGNRNYGGLTNTYNLSYDNTLIDYVTDEYYNMYSDTSVYWVGWDGLNGQRFINSNYSVQTAYPLDYSFEKIHFETDSLYSLGVTVNPLSDFRYFNNEKVSGEGWYWRNLTAQYGLSVSRSFSLPQLNPAAVNCTFRIFAYPNSKDSSFNEHKLVLSVNSTNIATLQKNDYERFDTTVNFSSSLLTPAQVNNVTVTYQPTFSNQQATPSLYFDLMEINYPKTYLFQNGSCRISLAGSDTSSALFRVTGFNAANPFSVYDIKNNYRLTGISTNADTLFFTGKKNGDFEIHNRIITKKPFRIISRQVPNLVSASNGADYIIIYNRLFENQSEQLRTYRSSRDNYRANKTAIDDIYDVFGYGMESPAALKYFTEYVYNNWQQPRVKYLCLMGRGSLDPKNNKLSQNYFRNFVPVYGNPPSDGYFVNFNAGGFVYYHQLSVGRLPVYTQQEAQDAVNKIIAYENEQPQSWWKNFIMITGGPNRNEQILFQTQSNQFVNSYINPPPVSGSSAKIYRNDSAGYITFNYADSIKKEFNRGGLLVNFIGHAANQDWELGLEDPSALNNGNKLPLVLSMTCYTGRNAEPNFRGFGEKFIYTSNKGAIGFLGTTGWSFSGAGNELNRYIFQGLARDTLRRLGELLKYSNNILAPDSGNFQVKNMINCYSMLGDPAVKLLLPAGPEFYIGQTDYRLTNHYPLVGEQVTLTIYPKNYGLYAPNCLIRFEILRNGGAYRFKDTTLTGFAYLDTAFYTFSIDTIGNYSLKVTLDYNNQYPQEDPSNNVLTVPLPLRNISFTPLKPVDNSVITQDSVEFTGLNPQADPRINSIKIILQLDTNSGFTNPLFNYTNSNLSGVATKVKYRIPILDSNIVYYWRTNSVTNGDSAGWSETKRFIYNPLTGTAGRSFISNDSIVTLYYKLPGQFNQADLNGVYYSGNGYELNNFSGQLQVKSYGSNSFEASFFIINNYSLYADGGENTGLNIVKVRRLTGNIVEFRNFRMNSPSSSDSVLAFLNTFDSTNYIMIGIASFVPGSDSLKQTAKNKIKEFGSTLIDSVKRFDAFDTYAFIGYLGAQPQDVSENFHRYASNNTWTPSYANLLPVFLHTSGFINFSTGPAHRWKYFSWERFLTAGSTVNFDLTGYTQNGLPVLLSSDISSNTFVNLDTLNSFAYPELQLKANLQIDTSTGIVSPRFRSLYFKYTPPAEIIPDNYSFIKSDSIVNEGAPVTISLRNYNVGFVPAGIVVYRWLALAPQGLVVLKSDTVYTPLLPDSSLVSSVTFNTSGLKEPSSFFDTLEINFEVQILNGQNDYYPFNNFAFTSIVIQGDSTGPSIDVTYNGEKILNGDIIPAKPEISFRFFDEGSRDYSIEDTAGIFIRLNGKRIYYSLNGVLNPEITFNAVNEGNLKTGVVFKPEFPEGKQILQFIGTDKDGNRDTLVNDVYVSYDFTVRNLYNYPNPMKSDTYFTFSLFSADAPEKCRIKIYTVAGRLIRDISANAKVGFNTIYWDGLDNDGEYMANGIYLYKLVLEGSGKTETSIQKLAILR